MAEPIRYEELLADYHASLTTVLRGFSAGVPFLQAWVPDEDHVYSLIGIAEAAREAGHSEVLVELSPQLLAGLDRGLLEQLGSELGEVSLDEGRLTLVFRDDSATPRARVRQAGVQAERERSAEPETQRARAESFELPAAYAARLPAEMQHRRPDPLEHSVTRQGATLQVRLDPATSTILEATHDGSQPLLELTCRLVEGRPLYEAADHGAGLVEGHLREDRLVPGIVLPETVGAGFALVGSMLRELWAQARGERVENFFDAPVAEAWRRLSSEGKIEVLERELGTHPQAALVSVVRVEGQRRVVVGFAGELNSEQKQSFLMDLERHLKGAVERQLHLYLEPRVDSNRLRQQKGIQL